MGISSYTIIIPHKNTPELLKRCLNSIPQRRGDVQVIIVDDNSDPNIVDFNNFPGSERNDVECYFTKEGKGAGYARNIGLKHAQGKWLLFADADDFFHPHMLDILDPWKDSTRDIIYFETDSVNSISLKLVAPRLLIHTSQISKEALEYNGSWVSPCGKMIRTELVKNHGILFEEIRWSNDVMFSARCSYHAGRNIDISNEFLYCATICENSLTTKKLTEESVMCRLDVNLRFERYLHNHKMSYSPAGDGVSSSFYWMSTMRNVNKDSFKRAKAYYLKHVCLNVLISDIKRVLSFRIRHSRLFHNIYTFYIKKRYPTIKELDIRDTEDTIDYILKNKVSVTRFGDGEYDLILNQMLNYAYQKQNEDLRRRLNEILHSQNTNIIICLPYHFKSSYNLNQSTLRYYINYIKKNKSKIISITPTSKTYYNTNFTRFYIDYNDKSSCKETLEHIKTIWRDRDVYIIEGEYSRLGMNNDLLDECRSVHRILCPATNAWDKYDKILLTAKQLIPTNKDVLVLISLGPAATVLAYDLSLNGYQAIDIGHINVEYMWYKMNATYKTPINQLYVNESSVHSIPAPCSDPRYQSSIIATIL